MKEVLIIYYSQTGQLFDILKNIASTISVEKVNISYCEILPKEKIPLSVETGRILRRFPGNLSPNTNPFGSDSIRNSSK